MLFKIRKRKDHDPNSNKIKTEGIKSTYDKKHRKKSRKIGNKKLHIGDEFNASDVGESPIFESFKKDFIKIKDEQAKSEGRRSYLFYRLTFNYFTSWVIGTKKNKINSKGKNNFPNPSKYKFLWIYIKS